MNVPKLEVPEIKIYESKNGNSYLVKRSLDEIAEEILNRDEEAEEE